ncbi:MAG: Uma2 family endonuclease [Candidatus Solibacter usitatus]|nr:Uma2 family endonuclease [Candidatus Solibacter usitatus]
MATKALISLEEYLKTSYPEMDCEYVDGEVFEKPMPPLDHARLQKLLLKAFLRWEEQPGLFAFPELRNRTAETRCRIPDIAVYAGAEPAEQVPSIPPYVVIEILSPDDKAQYLMAKLREYRGFGVPHIWVIDPASKSMHEYGSDGLREVAALRMPEYSLQVTHDDLFPNG